MTFEAQQKSVQDNGNYKGAEIYCPQKLEPEQWRFCDTAKVYKKSSLNQKRIDDDFAGMWAPDQR